MVGLNVTATEFKPPGAAPPPAPNGVAEAVPDSPEVAQVKELLSQLIQNPKNEGNSGASWASALMLAGVASLEKARLVDQIRKAAEDMGNPTAREGGVTAIHALAEHVGRPAEPYVLPLLPLVLERMGDKVPPVRDAAAAAGLAIVTALCPHAVPLALPGMYEVMSNARAPWQAREGTLKMLKQLTVTAPAQIAAALPDIVPAASECLVDAREQVKKASWSAMSAAFKLNGNRDIEPCVPALLSCIARPAEVGQAVSKLSGTTFVQAVEAPALAIMVPLLIRGLRHAETPIKRKTCVIIANMAKLVNNPSDATVFLPRLLPGLKILSEELADPECRSVASMSHATLLRMEEEAEEVQKTSVVVKCDTAQLTEWLREALKEKAAAGTTVASATLQHIGSLAVNMISARNYKAEDWKVCVADYLEAAGVAAADAGAVSKAFRRRCEDSSRDRDDTDVFDDGPGEELANCEFSLAYGGKILLNNARLIVKRGRRYGLCGGNGVGKSTLMKAIAAGKVEGFPPADQLRTVYVEHDIQASLEDYGCVDYILADPLLSSTPRQEVEKALASVGFTDELIAKAISSLSGGWKMKLALARAMLLQADILLLDEPTNHLDRANVTWLENYLVQAHITCLTVSHDSGFLDTVCTDIYHYENRRLKRYRGNLSEFVKVKPEARAYYSLSAAQLRFKFPEPAPLDGVTSREKSVLKMSKVAFTYPGNTKPTLTDITLHCRLSSRVAVLGQNGAGKSTLIKMLTGELKPQTGIVTRHPNLRVAYVAQHAFHHLEEHLDISPNRYILRRYSGGEDKEEASKVFRQMSPEEWDKIKNQVWMIDGQERRLDKLVARRKKKRSYEYEVTWVGLTSLCFNRWITREELIERGFEKLVNEVDGKKAAEQKVGEVTRPLTVLGIEEYLRDFGLEPEFGTHSVIRGLSGGQKVKLVLAAAMWSNPHMLIMDEPTNYLDRDSLGALANAIREFNGGVVVISHHAEFIGPLCSEIWNVAAGKLTITHAPQDSEGGPAASAGTGSKPKGEESD